jgi:hypothetical protein
MAFNIARAGARLGPSVIAALFFFDLSMRTVLVANGPKT